MTEPLIVIGAGGQGRETAFAHLLSADAKSFLGFLDDQATSTPEGWPVLGTIDDARRHTQACFIVGVNDPSTRRAIVRRLVRFGVARWGSVVHPNVRLHGSVHHGRGCAILGACQVTTNIKLGDHCILNRGCQVSHDCVIGDFCSLNPGACIAGNVKIDDGCEVGSACAIRQGTRVGRGSIVGMGAVVLADVAEGSVVVGNPARLLRSGHPW